MVSKHLFDAGVITSSVAILLALHSGKKIGVAYRDIISRSGLSKSLASSTLTALERRGLVRLHTPERDQRQTVVYLTDAGFASAGVMVGALNTRTPCTE